MSARQHASRLFVLALLAPLYVGLTACAPTTWNLSAFDWDDEEQPESTTAETCVVRFEPMDGAPEHVQVKMRQPMFVSDVLAEVHAAKKFRHMKITVHRMSPDNGRWHKMQVEYLSRKRGLDENTNYAIHPGDHVVIAEDSSTVLDRTLEAMNPLGRMTPRR